MGISLESDTDFNLNYGLESERPTDPLAGSVYLATDTNIMSICFQEGVWTNQEIPVSNPLSVDEGIVLFNGNPLIPFSDDLELTVQGKGMNSFIEIGKGMIGYLTKCGGSKSSSTGSDTTLRLTDKNGNLRTPDLVRGMGSGTGNWSFTTEQLAPFRKVKGSDKLLIAMHTNVSLTPALSVLKLSCIQAGTD